MNGWRRAARAGVLAGALMASACTEAPGGESAQGTRAAGEVQGGTISDAMIPLEQLTSQSPPAPRQAPAAGSIDAEQPEVTQAPGVEGGGAEGGAGGSAAASENEARAPGAISPDAPPALPQ